MQATEELAPQVGVAPVCEAIGLSRASLYRRRRPPQPSRVSFRQACVDPGSEALWAGGRRGGPYPWLRPARVVVALRQE